MISRRREATTDYLTAALYLVACVIIGVLFDRFRPTGEVIVSTVILVVIYAIAYRIEYTSQLGSMVPTQPVLVALLFTAPLSIVPVLVMIAQHLSRPHRPSPHDKSALFIGAGLHCIGPVVVLQVFGPGPADTSRWLIYLLALAAQFACDAVVGLTRQLAFRDPVRQLVRPVGWTFLIDLLLAPIGLSAMLGGGTPIRSTVFVAAPVALICVLARDRQERVAEATTLGLEASAARTEARIDELTGLANRRAWHEAVADATSRLEETGEWVSVVYADLDYLKHTNDTRGHAVGDVLIRAMADEIRRAARKGDVVARLGGDEFAMLITSRGASHSPHELIRRLQSLVAGCRLPDGLTLSASIGAASCPPEPNISSAILAAEQMAIRNKVARRVGRTEVVS